MQHRFKAGLHHSTLHPGNKGNFLTPESHKKISLFVIHGDYPGICQLRADMNFQTDGKKVTVSCPGF